MEADRKPAERDNSNSDGRQLVPPSTPSTQIVERRLQSVRINLGALLSLNAGLTLAEQPGLASGTS
jgi:hypothetical protein